MIDALL